MFSCRLWEPKDEKAQLPVEKKAQNVNLVISYG